MKPVDLKYLTEQKESLDEICWMLSSNMNHVFDETVQSNYYLELDRDHTDSDDYMFSKHELVCAQMDCHCLLDGIELLRKVVENVINHLNTRY